MAHSAFIWALCLVILVTPADTRTKRTKRQADLFGNLGGGTNPLDPLDPLTNPNANSNVGENGDLNGKCTPLQQPTNGQIQCDVTIFFDCTATCDQGYQFSNGQSSITRQCDTMTGEYLSIQGESLQPGEKPTLPTCVPICNPGCQNGGTCVMPNSCACPQGWQGSFCERAANGTVTGVPTSTHPPSAYAASCVAWGQDHYKTFDRSIYTFQGQCEYVLAKDCQANTYIIHVINDRSCNTGSPCKREIDVYMGSMKVSFRQINGNPKVLWDSNELSLPVSKDGNVFERIGSYVVMKSTSLGFMVRWDGKESIMVAVTADQLGNTCGLCGKYSNDKTDDFTTDSGAVVSSAASFATSWKRSALGTATCPDVPQQTCTGSAEQTATTSCSVLMGTQFQPCHSKIDPTPYMESCKSDCCSNGLQNCMCNTLEAYSRACTEAGVTLHWRTAQLCPKQCPGNFVYKECGSPCPKSCGSSPATCSDNACLDGCFCPDGMLVNGDTCISPDQCPCRHGEHDHPPGSTIKDICNTCVCTRGAWNCTKKKCDATCSATGDPHFMTFDKFRYNFMGKCTYYMMKVDDTFNVFVNTVQCGHGGASCTKSVTIDYMHHIIKLDHQHVLSIDGQSVTRLPYNSDGVQIQMVSSLFMKVNLANGVSILWDGRTRAYITAPPSFVNKTLGLCGTFDYNQRNEFLTVDGDVETDTNSFGNRFKAIASCRDEIPGASTESPCETNVQNKQYALQYCSLLKGDIFKPCHSVEDYQTDYEDCLYDVCSCAENIKDCLCPILGEYAKRCAARGVTLHWRVNVTECTVPCTGGQQYDVCPNECLRTCSNIANDVNCVQSPDCAEGCTCPPGQTLNQDGECIEISACPCILGDKEIASGTLVEKGDQVCTCRNARWDCRVPTPGIPLTNVQQPCGDGEEYTSCVSDCQVTCENKNSPPTCTTSSSGGCKEGCRCKPGYVREGEKCVLAGECPCHHGGKAYKENETMIMDCNECVCRDTRWQCTNNDCPAVCSAFGDSHYRSFDGKNYQFQGNCDYVLARSADDNPNKFQIITENIPCGTSGVTCTKSLTFEIGEPASQGFYRIQLVRGVPVIAEPDSPFHIQEVGNFIIVSTDTGITLSWDRGTRVYLKLGTMHKGKVVGLCGNFNGDQLDDFTMPQGGPPAVRASLFADSWKVHQYCASPAEITDTCQVVPHRKPWAQRQCGIISSPLFQKCHHVVPYQDFLDRCIFDTCACDMGGDCECMCTAVAAYAHQCAISGVPVKWRTEEFCPLQCANCETYNPCISLCPKKTCDNRLVYDSLTLNCKHESCVEGCDIAPCPNGQVYDSNTMPMQCIPEPFCNTTACVINGKNYKQNERITDTTVCQEECEICYCDNGVVKKSGFCVSTVSPITSRYTIVTQVASSQGSAEPTPATLPHTNQVSTTRRTELEVKTTVIVTKTTTTPTKVQHECETLLGISNPTQYSGDQFTASSSVDANSDAEKARLEGKGAWVARYDDQMQFIQIDFKQPILVAGIAIQGHPEQQEWVSKLTVSYSDNGQKFTPIKKPGESWPFTFTGNQDPATVVKLYFDAEIMTNFIRIHPTAWHNHIALRFDIISCFDVPPQIVKSTEGPTPFQIIPTESATIASHSTAAPTGSQGLPTSKPVTGSQSLPSVTPETGASGKPTVSPTSGSGGSPSAAPTGSQGLPTSKPLSGSQSQPSMTPETGASGKPTVSPTSGSGGSPSAAPTGFQGLPTSKPLSGSQSQPSMTPETGASGKPSVSPTSGSVGNPSASPTESQGLPTSKPLTGTQAVPTLPGAGIGFTGQPTVAPTAGSIGNPSASPTGSQGLPTSKPLSGSQSQPSVTPETGASGKPTVSPTSGSGGSPSAAPTGSQGLPTSKPLSGSQSQPSMTPETGASGKPTVSPTSGSGGSPSAAPTGSQGLPTSKPLSGSQSQPSVTPETGASGQPTVAPTSELIGNPSAAPTGSQGLPTSKPLSGSQSQPSMTPETGASGKPTVSPTSGSGGSPSAAPTGSQGLPTSKPLSGSQSQPSVTPETGASGQPTVGPTSGFKGNPSAAPTGSQGLPTSKPVTGSQSLPSLTPETGASGHPTVAPTSGFEGTPIVLLSSSTSAPCMDLMGIDNSHIVFDMQITASSKKTDLTGPSYGRLLNPYSAWVPQGNNKKEWIQVDFLVPQTFTGVVTQGHPKENLFVTKYVISTSIDGVSFSPYSENVQGEPKIFLGNTDNEGKATNMFSNPTTARFIRILPVEWSVLGAALRFNFIGCFTKATPSPAPIHQGTPTTTKNPEICDILMGVENKEIITDTQIVVSSSMSNNTDQTHSRLTEISNQQAWIPATSDKHPFIQIDFLEPKTLTGVVTKGEGKIPMWVTSYTVSTSLDGKLFMPYTSKIGGHIPKIFKGNEDAFTAVKQFFNRKVVAQYIRIYPGNYHGLPALQLNILGCNPSAVPSPGFTGQPTPEPGTVNPLMPTLMTGPETKTTSSPKPTAPEHKEPPKVCLSTMGVEDYHIVTDQQINSSSFNDSMHSASYGRMFGPTSWTPLPSDINPWIEIDFESYKLLSGVIVMGARDSKSWVTTFNVFTSLDGKKYRPYSDITGAIAPKTFNGNHDNINPVRQLFNRNITARFIRIYPLEFEGPSLSMRINVIGCSPDSPQTTTPVPTGSLGLEPTRKPEPGVTNVPTAKPLVCDVPMGINNPEIVRNFQLKASSYLDHYHYAFRGRIYTEQDGSYGGGWIPRVNNQEQYIQVDFLVPYKVSGVMTQGQVEFPYWVTQYQVSYSLDGKSFYPIAGPDGKPSIFNGNTDKNTPVTNTFSPVDARIVRIRPLEWHKGIGLRFNLIGCVSPTPAPTTMEPFISMRPITTTKQSAKSTTMEPFISGATPKLTIAPTSCQYWTPWVNNVHPDNNGEYESVYNSALACEKKYIKKIECRAVISRLAYNATGQVGVKCGTEFNGLVCLNKDQINSKCLDYEIRMFCDECTPVTTTSVTGTTPSPDYPVCNASTWSLWIDNHKPGTDGLEKEAITTPERLAFCNGGSVTKIECMSLQGIPFDSDGSIATCSIESGYLCKDANNYPVTCKDYKVRYYCNCQGPPINQNQPTPAPGTLQQHNPSQIPITGVSGSPSAKPISGNQLQPTLEPSANQNIPGIIPTTKTSTTTTPAPQKCSRWSAWLNRDIPLTGQGDTEFMTTIEKSRFCQKGEITKVECVTVEKEEPSSTTGDNTLCSVSTGSICKNVENKPFNCSDYKIRYLCVEPCEGSPSAQPTSGIQFTPSQNPPSQGQGNPTLTPGTGNAGSPSPQPGMLHSGNPTSGLFEVSTTSATITKCTQSKWSQWINKGSPLTGDGDVEYLTKSELQDFCIGGNVTKIECYTNDALDPISSQSSGDILVCDLEHGLNCSNKVNDPVQCQDYKIRYFCACEPEVETTTIQSTPSYVRCDWSEWLSVSTPTHDLQSGDFETIKALKSHYGLCNEIQSIECRIKDSSVSFSESGQNVTCDINNGLRCYNRDQLDGLCFNYEVRVLCWNDDLCNSSAKPTLPLFSTTPSTNVCAPGHIYDRCGFRCNDVCESLSSLFGECDSDISTNCIPMCVKVDFNCQIGEKLIDRETCVPEALCPCRKQDGSIAQPNETWVNPFETCSTCKCENNKIVCNKEEQCVISSSIAPTTTGGTMYVHPPCGFTNWINTDTPYTGQGDLELLSQIRLTHLFCANPISIECRSSKLHTEASMTGEKVSCDLHNGLTCHNWENHGRCSDYELRFYCQCPEPTSNQVNPSQVPSAGSRVSPTPKPICGWSNWLNTDNPTVVKPEKTFEGDIESITFIQKSYNLCPSNMILDIECRTASSKTPHYQTDENVLCNLSKGLECNNALQVDKKCSDYEIRIYCDCFKSPTAAPSGSQETPIITTYDCGWTTWMNGHKPNEVYETELFNDLRKSFRFCDTEDITGIECRKTTNDMITDFTTCDIHRGGFICMTNQQQNGICSDYEIRVYCEPKGKICVTKATENPPLQNTGNPSAQPNTGNQLNPSQNPPSQGQGNPTLTPGSGNTGSPSVQPVANTGSPSAQPNTGNQLNPSQNPPSQGQGNPTLTPGSGNTGSPSVQPSMNTGSPSAQPNTGNQLNPSQNPPSQGQGNPTLTPGSGNTGSPSVQPVANTGSPSAQPNTGNQLNPSQNPPSQGQGNPTLTPGSGNTGSPSVQPSMNTGSPSAQPNTGNQLNPSQNPPSKGQGNPTLTPGSGNTGSPSVQPSMNTGSPSAQPNTGNQLNPSQNPPSQGQGNPTLTPGSGNTGSPSVQPSMNTGSPSAQPNTGNQLNPSQNPPSQGQGNPTLTPGSGNTGSPSVQPVANTGSPSAQPNTGNQLNPSQNPPSQGQGNPTLTPGSGNTGSPSVQPSMNTGSPSAQPNTGNQLNPSQNPPSQGQGNPTLTPGSGNTGSPSVQPSMNTGSPSAQPNTGNQLNPSQNPPSQGQGNPTLTPGSGNTGSPSVQPVANTGSPSAQPNTGNQLNPSQNPPSQGQGNPTLTPGSGNTGSPSVQPSMNTGSPSAQPNTGNQLNPSQNPPSQGQGNPTLTPGSGNTGSPSVQPSMNTGSPSAQPNTGNQLNPSQNPPSQGQGNPTVTPGSGNTGSPSVQPVANTGSPSAQPNTGNQLNPSQNPPSQGQGNPTLTPGSGNTGSPSVQPSMNTGSPSAQPNTGNQLNPSQNPPSQGQGNPTLTPGSGNTGSPSVQPSMNTGSPSAAPYTGIFATPSLYPPTNVQGTPTPSPVCINPAERNTLIPMRYNKISATSSLSSATLPMMSTMNNIGWVAGTTNINEYITVDFGAPNVVEKIGTKGQANQPHWIKSYYLLTSMDGVHFTYYSGKPKIFGGNFDSNTTVTHKLEPFTARFVRLQPAQFEGAISLRWQFYGCTAALPTLAPTSGHGHPTTPTPQKYTTIIATPQPLACTDGWSSWINNAVPLMDSNYVEHEYMTEDEKARFCPGGNITQIKCATTQGTDYLVTGELLTCDVKSGLICSNVENIPLTCSNYQVKYLCKCQEAPTVKPTSVSQFKPSETPVTIPQGQPSVSPSVGPSGNPSAVPPACNSGWSSWINKATPSAEMSYIEREFMTETEKKLFCEGGNITAIECITVDGIPSESSGEELRCDVATGLTCKNAENDPIPCSDYQVRYMCKCAEIPTVKPTSVSQFKPSETPVTIPQGQPSVSPSVGPSGNPSAVPPACNSGWSSWINKATPSAEMSYIEREFMTETEKKLFCEGGNITAIECITVDGIPSESSGEELRCDVATGLTCKNAENDPIPCSDYQVRYMCKCAEIPTVKPTSVSQFKPSETPVTIPQGQPSVSPSVGPSGNPSAVPPTCNSGWSSWINKATPSAEMSYIEREFMTETEKKLFCEGGNITAIECITVDGIPSESSGEELRCDVATGLTCKNAENDPIQCSDYQVRYMCKCAEAPTAKPTSVSQFKPSETPVTIPQGQPSVSPSVGPSGNPSAVPPACNSGWSSWINKATPSAEMSYIEREFMTETEKKLFCEGGNITAIECITVDGIPSESSGEELRCDVATGLTCKNAENDPIPCSDYQVRYMCKCAETPTPTPASSQGQPSHSPVTLAHGLPSVTPSPGLSGMPTLQSHTTTVEIVTTSVPSETTVIPPVCNQGWTSWVDNSKPNSNHFSGEHEYLPMAELNKICFGGKIMAIECETSDGITSESSGEILTCDIGTGLTCNNMENLPIPCQDYRVRYLCSCAASPTAEPTHSNLEPTSASVTPTHTYTAECLTPLGVETGYIPDTSLTASSSRDTFTGASAGRLNGSTSWMAQVDNTEQWIQVDLGNIHRVTGVATQGRPNVPAYVSSYFVSYSTDGINWNIYIENSRRKIFNGNFDSNTVVEHFFNHAIRARYIRINPQTFYGKIAMRVEIIGCYSTVTTTTQSVSTKTTEGVPTPKPEPQCVVYDEWVNTFTPTINNGGDYETIQAALALGLNCHEAVFIECRTASGIPYNMTGQKVTCNTWNGLECNNTDQADPRGCYDYKIRLGCYDKSCVPTTQGYGALHETTTIVEYPIPTCYGGMDTTFCPRHCDKGLVCDGASCVRPEECSCSYNGTIMMNNTVIITKNCETCTCEKGHLKCLEKICEPCPIGFKQELNTDTCTCSCTTCPPSQFQCSNGLCITNTSRCDGVIDCDNDEIGCKTTSVIPNTVSPTSETAIPTQRPPENQSTPTPIPPHCHPDQCPKIVVPTLTYGQQTQLGITPDGCCKVVIVTCNTTLCPPRKEKQCIPPMMTQLVSISDCCSNFQCVMPPKCQYQMEFVNATNTQYPTPITTTHMVGEVWTDGLCKTCECMNTTPLSVLCHAPSCPTCSQGMEYVPMPNKCCGECRPLGCVVNGTAYKEGELIASPESCYTKQCVYDANLNAYIIREMHKECNTDVPICNGSQVVYDKEGCCKLCRVRNESESQTCSTCSPRPMFGSSTLSIGYFKHSYNNMNCTNTDPVDLLECSGYCESRTKYSNTTFEFTNTCNCCQPTSTSTRIVQLTCSDGSVIDKTYSTPTSCSCDKCS